ncbi:MAG: hypothetical protein A2557_03545, partial [Candidatus Lambdaproteobacteria bacterium RIFOXYD2_FULL_56_26]
MAIRIRILSNDSLLFCNFTDREIALLSHFENSEKPLLELKSGYGVRIEKISTESGILFAATTDKEYLSRNPKQFRAIALTLSSYVGVLKQAKIDTASSLQDRNRKILHNLVTLNGKNKQEIYSIIPPEAGSTSRAEAIKLISAHVKEESDRIADALFRIAKNNMAIGSEITVANLFFTQEPKIKADIHEIHRVLMNALYMFFADFTDKGVRVDFEKTQAKAYFDYTSVQVALYHLLDNAVKYILQNEDLTIRVVELPEEIKVTFQMVSIKIEPYEKKSIFEDGISGHWPKEANSQGQGVGLGYIKKRVLTSIAEIKPARHSHGKTQQVCKAFKNFSG